MAVRAAQPEPGSGLEPSSCRPLGEGSPSLEIGRNGDDRVRRRTSHTVDPFDQIESTEEAGHGPVAGHLLGSLAPPHRVGLRSPLG